MSALPPEQMRSMRAPFAPDTSDSALVKRWDNLHEAANELARTAGLSPERAGGAASGFAACLTAASGWQRSMVVQGIDDIEAMMRPGLEALDTLTDREVDVTVPAQALWREFHHAREAVLALIAQRAA